LGLFYFVRETSGVNGFLILLGLVPQARWVFLLSLLAIAGTAMSLYFFVKSFGSQPGFQKILSGLMVVSLVWCSAIVFHYQLWPW